MNQDDWEVGQSVNELLWLISDDPDGLLSFKHALEYALGNGSIHAAEGTLYILCFLAGEAGLDRYHEIATIIPGVKNLPGTQELLMHLEEHGELGLFSFAVDDLVRNAGRISHTWPP